MDVGYWIKYYRNQKNLTSKEFANLCGCSHGSIRQIENGRRYPSIKNFLRMVEVLNVPLNCFFRDINKQAGIYTQNLILNNANLSCERHEKIVSACLNLCDFFHQ